MFNSRTSRTVATICFIAAAIAAAATLRPDGDSVRAEDRNHDGRPDVWRRYDAQGRLTAASIDTNFDGRSDVREYYRSEALVRRESDRNFDDRVDLVEEFDPATAEPVRSVFDVNYDGAADLLVLFQAGQPVFSKWMNPAEPPLALAAATTVRGDGSARRTGDDALAGLEDPFSTDTAVRPAPVPSGVSIWVDLSTSGGIPLGTGTTAASPPASARLSLRDAQPGSLAALAPRAPRGPPVSLS